jgi:hypothetical protein
MKGQQLTRDEKIDKIYNLLVGDEDLRQDGLIKRVEDLEKKSNILDMFWAKVTGGVLVLSIIGSGLFTLIAWLYNKAIH